MPEGWTVPILLQMPVALEVGDQALGLGLFGLRLLEEVIAVVGTIVLALLTWAIARRFGGWLQGSTRLGVRGLEKLAAPISLLTWLVAAWITLHEAVGSFPKLEELILTAIIGASFWVGARSLDVVWTTAGASARLRTQPAAKGVVLASRLLGKVILFLIAAAIISVRLGASEQLYLALGAIGAAVAFAARGPITNVFAFIQLILDPPFRIGDRVRIGDFRGGDPVEGELIGITLSAMTIRSSHRTEISVSNAMVAQLRVENLSIPDRRRLLLVMPIGAHVSAEDLRSACDAIEEKVKKSPWVSKRRPPHVWISGYDLGLELKVSLWLKRKSDRRDAQRELFLTIRSEFEKHVEPR